jgi:MATE family multidrug resistance protein
MGVLLMRFVAVYCLLDGCNVIFVSSLQGAGDTHWTFVTALLLNLAFVAGLGWMDYYHATLYQLWGLATFFVMFQAVVWLLRFRAGAWKQMRVIEQRTELKIENL